MNKTLSAGGIVLNAKGQVLVVNQNGNSWSLPKGHIDAGEDAITAAKREIYEESGVSQVTFIKNLGTYSRYKIGIDANEDQSEWKTMHMFLFTTKEKTLKPIDPDNPEARWVEKDKVAELLTHPKDREFYLTFQTSLESSFQQSQ